MTYLHQFLIPFFHQPRYHQARTLTGLLCTLVFIAVLTGYAGLGQARANHDNHPATAQSSQEASAQTPERWVKGRLLITPRAGLSLEELKKTVAPYGVRPKHHVKELDLHICELPEGVDEKEVKRLLKEDHRLKNVELDMIVTLDQTVTDPSFNRSWALPKIEAPDAWDISTGDGIIVAVLDTGVDGTHPDLAANMVPGWNIFDNNDNTADVHNHGTWVAGTIAAAANNGMGSAGVAWSAEIMPVRIAAPDATAFFSTIANGIRWAADHGAKVVNVSYSGVAGSSTIRSAAQYLRNKGGVLVVSAGNSGSRLNYSPSDVIMAVSATNSNDQRPNWSSYGSYVDIAAPGESIFTTSRGGGYSFVQGTSFSSPIVAATAALMFSANHELTPADLDQLILSTTTDLGEPGFDDFYGAGRVDAAAAVFAANAMLSIDDQAPSVTIVSPSGGEVTGIVAVDVEATDNVGVVRTELWVNGKKTVTDTLAPFAFAWDSSNLASGDYTLTVRAFDAAGNQGVSQDVLVTVDNSNIIDDEAPVISISAPTGGEVSGIVNVNVDAADNVAVARVALFVNGQQLLVSDQSPFAFAWDTTLLSDGVYDLTAHAFDEADNEGVSSAVSVTVRNAAKEDVTPPEIIRFNLTDGMQVRRRQRVIAVATDNEDIAQMRLIINGQVVYVSNENILAVRWTTRSRRSRGGVSYQVTIEAVDQADNVTRQTVTVHT